MPGRQSCYGDSADGAGTGTLDSQQICPVVEISEAGHSGVNRRHLREQKQNPCVLQVTPSRRGFALQTLLQPYPLLIHLKVGKREEMPFLCFKPLSRKRDPPKKKKIHISQNSGNPGTELKQINACTQAHSSRLHLKA